MTGVATLLDVNQTGRTYAARLGSRDGAILWHAVAQVLVEPNTEGYANDVRSNATLEKWDVTDGVLGSQLYSVALDQKISYALDVSKSCDTYAARFGSRNGAQLSSVGLVDDVEASEV